MQVVAHEFRRQDFIAGHTALDFINTVTARDTTPRDWLDGYQRLIEWAAAAGVVSTPVIGRLRAGAERSPREAAAALGRARKFREALHDTFVALLASEPAPASAVAEIETAWKRASARARMMVVHGLLQLQPDVEASGLDLPLDAIAFSAVDLLGGLKRERTRVCRGPDCGWLFIDSSKGGRRVWCDMATCGNASKSTRFARAAKRRRRAGSA
jgi:predicted RNA-binding Zn ribbon-like protein